MIDDALAKIAAWEAACSPTGVPVQFVVGQTTRPVSEILTQYKDNICIESKGNTGEDATTSPEAGVFPDSSGLGFHVVSGFGTNLNPALFGENELGIDPCIQLALVLVHEAYHLENPTKWNDDLNTEERAAHDFSMGWYCTIAGCESDADVKADICKYWSKLSGRLLGDPYCFPPYDCPHCPPTIAGVAWGVHPEFFHSQVEEVSFRDDLGGGLGNVILRPDQLSLECRFIDELGVQSFVLDFAVELPNFTPTCFSLREPANVQEIGVAGYDSVTGDGMLIVVSLDFNSTPFFALSTKYKGDGFGIPDDIFFFDNSVSKIFVLDAQSASVIMCNTVSDTCTVLASPQQAPSLSSMHFLDGFRGTFASGTQAASLFVTPKTGFLDAGFAGGFPQAGVLITDLDLDGQPDSILEFLGASQ